MPAEFSVPLAILFYHLFKFLFGITVATPLFAGFVAGYLAYDTTLHAVHHFRLPGRLGCSAPATPTKCNSTLA